MILLRLQRTFRERAPEWALAFIQTGWGITLLLPGGAFNRPFFQPLAVIATAGFWGWAMLLTGMGRFLALFINGSMRQTPHARQVCSLIGMGFWALLTFSGLSLQWRTPSAFTYAGLFVLEAIMFSYAGRDAARTSVKVAADGAI